MDWQTELKSDPALSWDNGVLRITPSDGASVASLLRRIEVLGMHLRKGNIRNLLIDTRGLTHLGSTEQVVLSHHCG